MDQILHSWFYILHHSIYLKTNFLGPQLRAIPLFYQYNGYKKGRRSQTTFTIAQPLFQCMLNLVKLSTSAATQFFSWIYAPEWTLRKDPTSFIYLDAWCHRKPMSFPQWPLRFLSANIPLALKILLLSPNALLGASWCPLLSALFQQHKGSGWVCATEVTALQKNRSTGSVITRR